MTQVLFSRSTFHECTCNISASRSLRGFGTTLSRELQATESLSAELAAVSLSVAEIKKVRIYCN